MQDKKDVVLVFAGKRENVPRLPMAILALGAYIREKNFNPILIDMRQDDIKSLKIDWSKVLCVGISSMSGPPISEGLNFAKMVRSVDASIPIVWGGPHASFFPEQTVESEYVDYVVRYEGEIPLLGLLHAFQSGEDVSDVPGITYMKDGKPVSNKDSKFVDIETLPMPAYDLLDMDKYLKGTGNNISYEMSRGCPYRCSFCYVHFFHKRQWRAKSVKKIMFDLKTIVKNYSPKEIMFAGDNFFVDKGPVLEVANAILDEGLKFDWNTNVRADSLSRCTVDELKLMRKSGCTYLSLGVESGSERVLKMIKKDITKDQVRDSIKKCLAADIMPMISLIVGLPGETKEDINETLDFYDEMVSFGPKVVEINTISIYSPYPGTPIFEEACRLGYKPFTRLEDWSVWQVDDPKYVPWYSPEYRKELDLISSLSRFKYFVHRLEFYPKDYKKAKVGSAFNMALYNLAVPVFSLDADVRWKKRLFNYSAEWKLFDIARDYFIKAK